MTLTKAIRKKLKKLKNLLQKRGIATRIPIAPPSLAHKDKSKYNRKRFKKNVKKEIKENT